MNVALHIAQTVLALTFLASGIAKSTMSKPRMIETGQTGVAPFPLPVIRLVAALEIAGAAGLVLPWLTGINLPYALLAMFAAVGRGLSLLWD